MTGKTLFAITFAAALGGSALAQTSPNDEIFYQVMPIAFRNANGGTYKYGDFNGLTASIPYLKSLKVTGIWLNPIFPTNAYHGYQHEDPTNVNSRFGTMADWINFVHSAHANGIKVYIDFVAYGTSTNSPQFQNAYNNPSSIYTNWFSFNSNNTAWNGFQYPTWSGQTVSFAYWNLFDPLCKQHVIDSFKFWMDPNNDQDFSDGVDGFRIDSAWPAGNYGSGGDSLANFWNDWKVQLKAKNPSVFVFAEQGNWSITGRELMPAFDGTFTMPLMFATRDSFNSNATYSVKQTLAFTWGSKPPANNFLGIIGNHDVDRFNSVMGDSLDRSKAGAGFLMGLPFIPTIYSGDELGMRGTKNFSYNSDANDIPMREPFKWLAVEGGFQSEYYKQGNPAVYAQRYEHDNDGRSVQEQSGNSNSVLETYRQLATIRSQIPALRQGAYEPIPSGTPQVLSYIRRLGNDAILVLTNFSNQPANFSLNLSSFTIPSGYVPVDLLSGNTWPAVTLANKSAYSYGLGPNQIAYLRLQATRTTQKEPIDGYMINKPRPYTQVVAQTNPTTFANNDGELDFMRMKFDSDGLYLGIAGNLPTAAEASLVIFIDSKPGGSPFLGTSNFGSTPAGILQLSGLFFDAAFKPDLMYVVNEYVPNFYVDKLPLTGLASNKIYVGTGTPLDGIDTLSGGTNPNRILASLNHGNTGGVDTGSATNALTADRGLEMKIPYAELGIPNGVGQSVKIVAFLVRNDGTVTNQWLPALPNHATDLGLHPNMQNVPGNQFYTLPFVITP